MGPDVLDELEKPKKNTWVEQQIAAGAFGGEGAGLEAIAGGGMHSLFIDEKGTVRYQSVLYDYFAPLTSDLLDMVVRPQRRCRPWTYNRKGP